MSVPRIELADQTAPVVPDGWRERAACRGHGDLFFPGEHAATAEVVREIRAMCAACPVLAECREDALTAPEAPHGWQAGMSPGEQRVARRGVPKRRRHGRRRAVEAQCGTRAGYQSHWRRGEDACEACAAAAAAYMRSRRMG